MGLDALAQAVPALAVLRHHVPGIELQLAAGRAGVFECRVPAALSGQFARGFQREVVDGLGYPCRQRARLLAVERQPQLEEHVLQAHHAEPDRAPVQVRSEEHTSELQSLMRISYAVFCLKKKKEHAKNNTDS